MPRFKNHLLRTHFEVRSDKHVICKMEKCSNKLLSIHSGNLERHLKTFHQSVYYSYLQKKNNNIANTSKCDTVQLACSANQKHIQMALIELFTKCGRPLSMAEDKPFKLIMNPVLEGLKINLCEQSIIESIAEFSLNIKKELSAELSGKLVSLKIDAATRASKSLLGVNVQIIKNNNVVLKTLGIKQLTEPHTRENLKTLILEVLTAYNLTFDQVITITAGNGAEMIETPNGLNSLTRTCSDEECVQDDLICMDLDYSIDGINCVRSGAQILQMCVADVLTFTEIQEKLLFIRRIAKKLTTALYLTWLKGENYQTPILDTSSRWTSTYHMVERFMELKDFIEVVKHDAAFEVSNEIWHFAAEFLSVFNIIYATSKKLQSENFIYSDLCIEITNITLQLDTLPKSDMKLSLLESLNRQKLRLFEDDLFVSAVFLDPRIKVCLASDQCARAKNCILQLYSRLLYVKDDKTNIKQPADMHTSANTPASSAAACLTAGNAEDALEEYFKAFDQASSSKMFTTSQQIEQDILAYGSQSRLGIKENIISFWSKQNNALSEIALLILGIPCTQLSAERLFSALDYIQANQDSICNSTNLEHILLVKYNGEFIYS